MSKIFGENLVIATLRALWKRFAASATAYGHKYRYDPFFRTEARTVALLVLFSLLILGVVAVSSGFLYRDVITAISSAIDASLTAQLPPSSISGAVALQLEELQSRSILISSGVVILVTIIAGYVLARVVLSPTRNALESQKQFIGNVAHELRTPLSIIKTNAEVALLDPDTREVNRKVFVSTVEELDRISEIINNLLSLSASVRPERIEFEDVDLGTVVEHSMRKLSDLSGGRQIEITARFSDRRIVWGNPTALEQIATNLIKNAIMYNSEGGHIAVTVEPVYPDFMELTVQDSGVGIARADLFRIFEPFYRAERSRNRAKGGVGLGLPIVSELVKLHHGKITVRSVEGRGTTVFVLLPAGKQSLGVQREGSREGRKNVSEIAVDFSHNNQG